MADLETIKAKQQALIEDALHIDYRTPDHLIIPWTPAEREALGINDTMRWIEQTQRILDSESRNVDG